MTDTSTKTVERLARELDEPSNTLRALAAERDKWHAGWMETEAKVSELEAERDALKAELHEARMQAIVDFGKLQEACEENTALKAALALMVYETTHLSPVEEDGSHWCRITGPCLAKARAALQEKTDD